MARFAELYEKIANGTANEAEKKEFAQLQAEAKLHAKEAEGADADDDKKEDEEEDGDEAEAKAVDSLAQKLADAATSRITKGIEEAMKGINTPVVVAGEGDAQKFLIDPKHGKKSFEEAMEIKVVVPGRENKTYGKEVNLHTVHFVKALIEGDKQKLQLLVEGTGSRGGYLVPEEFANMIVEDARDIQLMRQIGAPAMTIQGDTLHLPGLNSRPKAAFRTETASKNTSTVDFGENVFTPYSLAVIVGLSNELAADASLGVNGSIVNYVANLMAVSIGEREERAFWTGGGSGEPTGITNYSLRTVVPSSGSDEDRAMAVIALYRRMPQGYRNKAVFVANSATLERIDGLKDTNGRFLLSELADSPVMRLKGRPVYEQNDLPGGTLLFGDFGYYQIVDRQGIEVRISDEATVAGRSAFEDNLTYIRVEKRVDGELTLTAAVSKATGMGNP